MSHLEPGWISSDTGNRTWLSQVGNWLVDLVFPPVCSCGRVDYHFCAGCLQELQHFPLEPRITSRQPLNGLASTGIYDGILGQAIRAFKYNGVTSLDKHLAARLQRVYEQTHWSIDLIIPVPLAEKRLDERGYNQSEMLGACMSDVCGIPCRSDFIRRIRETDQQARLSGEQRMANVRDAFEAADAVKSLAILLIDDVVTTGSTLNECARALKREGARAVYGLTVGYA
ncbi:MAG: ComF family protein [Chloroflexota bacterium]|nr:ComF family protein [Chloroflexota bacterium]